jgi:hypothetical protein
MRLFLTVVQLDETHDYEPEWVIHANEQYPNDLEVKKVIKEHLSADLDPDFADEIDVFDNVEDYWTNEITDVKGYKVKLVKE